MGACCDCKFIAGMDQTGTGASPSEAASAAASGTIDVGAAGDTAAATGDMSGSSNVDLNSNQATASTSRGEPVEPAADTDSSDTDSQSNSSSSRGPAAATGVVASHNSRAGDLAATRVDEALRQLSQPSRGLKLIRKFLRHQEDIFAQFPEIYKVQEDLWLLESHIASLHEAGTPHRNAWHLCIT